LGFANHSLNLNQSFLTLFSFDSRTQQQMLKEQKLQTIESMAASSKPMAQLSSSRDQIPSSPPLPINAVPADCIPIQTTKIEHQTRPPFINIPNSPLSLLNTIENCKGNPSAAAALVMMNAILASQQNQVYFVCKISNEWLF